MADFLQTSSILRADENLIANSPYMLVLMTEYIKDLHQLHFEVESFSPFLVYKGYLLKFLHCGQKVFAPTKIEQLKGYKSSVFIHLSGTHLRSIRNLSF